MKEAELGERYTFGVSRPCVAMEGECGLERRLGRFHLAGRAVQVAEIAENDAFEAALANLAVDRQGGLVVNSCASFQRPRS
jgi:hypothetical protein